MESIYYITKGYLSTYERLLLRMLSFLTYIVTLSKSRDIILEGLRSPILLYII